MTKLTVGEVESILRLEKSEALGVNSSTLAEERKTAMDYYLGDMDRDMPSHDGRSHATSSDVSDTVEGIMPALMEVFAAGEEVVRFEPVGIEDEQAADQETDYVNHIFMQRNTGFLILYSFIKDALLSKIGIVKVYWDKYEREERETYENLDDETYVGLLMRPGMEVISHEDTKDPDTGQTLHTVVLTAKKSYACAKVEPIPPEDFGIRRTAKNIKDATYIYHEPAGLTESDLIAQGYDRNQVESLAAADERKNKESMARDHVQGYGGSETLSAAADKSMREIRVTEHYKVMDYEGDGKPLLYRITTGGERFEILKRDGKPDIQLIDQMPFAAMTPIIMTHRFFGRSIADMVVDIQRIKTALLRSLLDNAYLANNQRVEVAETTSHERTLDDLLVNRPGGVVRVKQSGCITQLVNQPIGDFVFPLIEYVDQTREFRTGVTRQGQGIDADALQNQSATAVNQMFSAAQAKIKLIARVLAETGIRDLFSLLHATIRKNDTQVNTVRLRNRWVQVDPRNWKTRDDMTINVGLGNGSRDQQVAHLMTILGLQKEAMLAPGQNIVEWKNIYNTAEKLIQLIGLKAVTPYFNDPAQTPAKPMPPDPKQMEIQAKAQSEMAKMQADAAHQKMKTEADVQLEQQKLSYNTQMEQTRFEFEKQLALIKAQLEQESAMRTLQLKEQEMAHEAALREQEMRHKEAVHGMSMQAGAQKHQNEAQKQNGAQDTAHTQILAELVKQANTPKNVTVTHVRK